MVGESWFSSEVSPSDVTYSICSHILSSICSTAIINRIISEYLNPAGFTDFVGGGIFFKARAWWYRKFWFEGERDQLPWLYDIGKRVHPQAPAYHFYLFIWHITADLVIFSPIKCFACLFMQTCLNNEILFEC